MTSPAITQNQQRKTLSAKKGPTKGLKNVLATPHENYWPLLKNDHNAALENLLIRLLPALKRTEQKVPWSHLRKMNKEQKLAAKKAAQIQSNAEYDKIAAKSIVFGINAVTRLLEKDNASCVLLETGVDPSLLIKHVLIMSKTKNVPVLLISFLKKVTLQTVGFASAAISLKKDTKESIDNYFHELYEKVSKLFLELPKTKTPVSLFQSNSIIEDKSDANHISIAKMEEDVDTAKSYVTVSTDVYLYRTSKKERVFKPDSSSHSKPNTESTKWSDFIALSDEKCEVNQKNVPLRFFDSASPNSNKSNSTNNEIQYHKKNKTMGETSDSNEQSIKVTYKPLKVKRLQGNESRKKATKTPKVKKRK